jgi:hypothetical protein
MIKGKAATSSRAGSVIPDENQMEPNTILLAFIFCYLPFVGWIAAVLRSRSAGSVDLNEEEYLFIARMGPRKRR